jgi:hypothetical protein
MTNKEIIQHVIDKMVCGPDCSQENQVPYVFEECTCFKGEIIRDLRNHKRFINSGKYKIEGNQIININTDIAIPADEPVFILRAKDVNALATISDYYKYCNVAIHAIAVKKLYQKFLEWKNTNLNKIKEPD